MRASRSENAETTESRRWLASAVLNATVLEPLYELNHSWLTLLASAPRYWAANAGRTRSADPVPASLVTLTAERRAIVARCPFSLFNVRFNDGAYWLGIAGNSAVHEPQPAEAEAEARNALSGFAELALFFAWHLARANPPAARVVLGMADQTLATFEGLALTHLQRVALSRPGLVTPRWPERSAFWLRLLESLPESSAMSDVRLIGLQMLAAELGVDKRPDENGRRPAVER
jgi:hypothetical protein